MSLPKTAGSSSYRQWHRWAFAGGVASAALLGAWYYRRREPQEEKPAHYIKLNLDQARKLDAILTQFFKKNIRGAYVNLIKLGVGHPETKELVQLIESEQFERARHKAYELFGEHPIYATYLHAILCLIHTVIGEEQIATELQHRIETSEQFATDRRLKDYLEEIGDSSNPKEEVRQYWSILLNQKDRMKSRQYSSGKTSYWEEMALLVTDYDYSGSFDDLIQRQKLQVAKQPDNRVIVRIWLPDDGMGHVSLQTDQVYASFWPSEYDSEVFGKKTGKHFNDFVSDIRDESSKLPDYRFTFYSLDAAAASQAFIEFKNSADPKQWHVLGSSVFAGESKNCIGLVRDLLQEGEIECDLESKFQFDRITGAYEQYFEDLPTHLSIQAVALYFGVNPLIMFSLLILSAGVMSVVAKKSALLPSQFPELMYAARRDEHIQYYRSFEHGLSVGISREHEEASFDTVYHGSSPHVQDGEVQNVAAEVSNIRQARG